jgi:3-phenylpropionate/cinnamic acid dioxygenase small subunit
MSTPTRSEDTRFSSWYVDEEFYAAVGRDVATWSQPSVGLDPAEERAVTAFLIGESKLLDQGRLRDWLGLFADDCLYWLGTTTGSPDPTVELCTAFDDRRRLEDRVVRLETGTAYSQLPPSRTCRGLSSFEYWPGDGPDELRSRCVFTLAESRLGELRLLSGWYGFTLRRAGGSFRIVRKHIDLLEADVHLRNLSLVL